MKGTVWWHKLISFVPSIDATNFQIINEYRKLKPLIQTTTKLLFWVLMFGIGFYIPFFAFQLGIVLTNAQEEGTTILFYCLRQYLSMIIFMGVPSEIHRLVLTGFFWWSRCICLKLILNFSLSRPPEFIAFCFVKRHLIILTPKSLFEWILTARWTCFHWRLAISS